MRGLRVVHEEVCSVTSYTKYPKSSSFPPHLDQPPGSTNQTTMPEDSEEREKGLRDRQRQRKAERQGEREERRGLRLRSLPLLLGYLNQLIWPQALNHFIPLSSFILRH